MAFDLAKLKKMTAEQLAAAGLTAEDVVEIEKGFMLQSDYTTKTQEVAQLKRIMDANPGLNVEEALAELRGWQNWRTEKWPSIEEQLRAANEGTPRETREPAKTARSRRKRDYTIVRKSDDLWETEKLFAQFDEIADLTLEEATTAAVAKTTDLWQKEWAPGIQKVANDYLATVAGPMKAMWRRVMVDDKGQPLLGLEDVFKEMQVSGEADFMKVYDKLAAGRTTSRKQTFEEGIEEGKRLAAEATKAAVNGTATGTASPPGPTGRSSPAWTPPPKDTKLTKEQRYSTVMQQVEKRHGALPA